MTQDEINKITETVGANMTLALRPLTERLAALEAETKKTHAMVAQIDAKLGSSEESFGDLLQQILAAVSERHANLENRVERLETHLGLPKIS